LPAERKNILATFAVRGGFRMPFLPTRRLSDCVSGHYARQEFSIDFTKIIREIVKRRNYVLSTGRLRRYLPQQNTGGRI
jgi:hypothetical protein